MAESLVIGVDIGGSHITAAVVDLDTQCILLPSFKRSAVNAGGSADEILSTWSQVINETRGLVARQPTKIGLAMPGPFDYEQGISYIKEQGKYKNLYGLNVKQQLAEKLALAPTDIALLNDAACFLKGEVFSGAAKGCSNVLGLTLGTGFGTAIYTNGKVEDANLWCDPYKDGIAEDLFSTRWFLQRCFELTGNRLRDVKAILDTTDNRQVVLQLFTEFGVNLGTYLSSLAARFSFETVVLGGNIARSFALFSDPLQQALAQNQQAVTVVPSVLNENAALVGAASTWTKTPAEPTILQYH